jgi:hypothetical protein
MPPPSAGDARTRALSLTRSLKVSILEPEEIADPTFREFQFRFNSSSNHLGCWVYITTFHKAGPFKANPDLLAALLQALKNPATAQSHECQDCRFEFEDDFRLFLVRDFDMATNVETSYFRESVLQVRRAGAIWRTGGISALMKTLIPVVRQRLRSEALVGSPASPSVNREP